MEISDRETLLSNERSCPGDCSAPSCKTRNNDYEAVFARAVTNPVMTGFNPVMTGYGTLGDIGIYVTLIMIVRNNYDYT